MFSKRNEELKFPMETIYVCPMCLSRDRHFYMLDGALSDLTVILEIFHKENSKQAVCWECYANIEKILRFKNTASRAQQILQKIDEESEVNLNSFSRLKMVTQTKVITLTSKDMQKEKQETESSLSFLPSPPPSSLYLQSSLFCQPSPLYLSSTLQPSPLYLSSTPQPSPLYLSSTPQPPSLCLSSPPFQPLSLYLPSLPQPSSLNLPSSPSLPPLISSQTSASKNFNPIQSCKQKKNNAKTRKPVYILVEKPKTTEKTTFNNLRPKPTMKRSKLKVLLEKAKKHIKRKKLGKKIQSVATKPLIVNDTIDAVQYCNGYPKTLYKLGKVTNDYDKTEMSPTIEVNSNDIIVISDSENVEFQSDISDHETPQYLSCDDNPDIENEEWLGHESDEDLTVIGNKELTDSFDSLAMTRTERQQQDNSISRTSYQHAEQETGDKEKVENNFNNDTNESSYENTSYILDHDTVQELQKQKVIAEMTRKLDDIDMFTDENITNQKTCNEISSLKVYSITNDDHLIQNFDAIAEDIQTPNIDDEMTIPNLSQSTGKNEKQDANIETLIEESETINNIVHKPDNELVQHSTQEQENATQHKASTVVCANKENISALETKENLNNDSTKCDEKTNDSGILNCDNNTTITDIKSCIDNINRENLNLLKLNENNTDPINSPHTQLMHDLVLNISADQQFHFENDTHSESVDHDATINEISQNCNENTCQTLIDRLKAKPQFLVTKITADKPWKHLNIEHSPVIPKPPKAAKPVQKTPSRKLPKRNKQSLNLATLKSLEVVIRDHRYAKNSSHKWSELHEKIKAADCTKEIIKIRHKTRPRASILKKQPQLKVTKNTRNLKHNHPNANEDCLKENQSKDEHLTNELENQNKFEHLINLNTDEVLNEDNFEESTENHSANNYLKIAKIENHSENEHLKANTKNYTTDTANFIPDDMPMSFFNMSISSIDLSKFFPGPPVNVKDAMSTNVIVENYAEGTNENVHDSLSQCGTEEDEINIVWEPIDSDVLTGTARSIDDQYYEPLAFDFGENSPDFIDKEFHYHGKDNLTETRIDTEMNLLSHLFTKNLTVNTHSNSNIDATLDQLDKSELKAINNSIESIKDQVDNISLMKTKDDSVELKDANNLLDGVEDNLIRLKNTEDELLEPIYFTPFVDETYSYMIEDNNIKSHKSKSTDKSNKKKSKCRIRRRRKPKSTEKTKASEQRKTSETQKRDSDKDCNKSRLLRKRMKIDSLDEAKEANDPVMMSNERMTFNPTVEYEINYIPNQKRMKIDSHDVKEAIMQEKYKDDYFSLPSVLELETYHNPNQNRIETDSFDIEEQNMQENINKEKYSLPLIEESNENNNSNQPNSTIDKNQDNADKMTPVDFNDNNEIGLNELEFSESLNELNSNTKIKKDNKEITHQEPGVVNLSKLVLRPIVILEKNETLERMIRSDHKITKERNEIKTTNPRTNESHEEKLTPTDFIENNKEITLEELEGEFQDDVMFDGLDTITEVSTPNIAIEEKSNKTKDCKLSRKQICKSFYTEKIVDSDEQTVLEDMTKNDSFFMKAEHKCFFCVQVFSDCKLMSKHMKLHEEDAGQFVCEKCTCRFRNKNALILHNTMRHKKCFQCNWCDSRFMFIHLLKNHVERAHLNAVAKFREKDARREEWRGTPLRMRRILKRAAKHRFIENCRSVRRSDKRRV